MIRSIIKRYAALKRGAWYGQQGGVAILTALTFLVFSVPVITGSLSLASTIDIDARVKTDIVHRDYCGLSVHQYTEYLVIDTVRWDGWLAANEDPGFPGEYAVATDVCGETIDIGVTQQADLAAASYNGPPLGDPLITIPGISDYDDRRFQTFKAVSDPNPTGGDPVNYTITVVNRDADPAPLVQIQDNLPAGFAYDWTAVPSELTLPGMPPQDIDPTVIPGGGTGCAVEIGCIGKSDVVLVLDNSGSINAAELAILKDAAKLLVDSFYLHETYGSIIGITRFNWVSTSVHVMSDDAASLKAAIDDVDPAPWWAFTNIVAGLEGAAAQFATGQGDRVYPNVIIFITDGDDTTGNDDDEIAAAMAATGAEVFAIGVGDDVTDDTVDAIATDPDEGHSFHTDDFDGLLDLIDTIVSTRDLVLWDMPPGTTIMPGDEVTLTFTSETSLNPGTYCNEVQVIPGGPSTRSGETAVVQIGPDPGLCPGEAVLVTKVMDSVNLVSTDTSAVPFTYTFDIDYTITVDNIGTGALTIDGFIDLLPEGYSYLSTSPSGDITDGPSLLEFVSAVDRQRVTWQFSPPVSVAAGTAKTLIFSTTTAIDRGNYWNDLLVDFGGGTFDEDVYTWPTALVSVKDAYDVTASNGAGVALVDLKVQTGDLIGVIESWYIR